MRVVIRQPDDLPPRHRSSAHAAVYVRVRWRNARASDHTSRRCIIVFLHFRMARITMLDMVQMTIA